MNLPPFIDSLLRRARGRPYARAGTIFIATLLLGFLAWPWLAAACTALFRALCTLALGPLEFGRGGHVAFSAASGGPGLERAASWDARMVLAIQGVAKTHAIALNPRRLLYLPLLTLLASVSALPLPGAARRRALLAGLPIVVALALATVWLTAVFLFARVPELVYSLSPLESALLRVGYEGFATPLTTKFMLPLLLAYGLFVSQSRCVVSAPVQAPTASGSQKAARTRPNGKRKRRRSAAGARRA